MAYVYEELQKKFDVTVFFFNPNIMPSEEYSKRLDEIVRFSKEKGFELIIEEEPAKYWVAAVKEFRFSGEKSERCWICYKYRLEKTFRTGKRLNFDIIATTLSISPHKIAVKINEAGRDLASLYNIDFLLADFKKNDGFKKSALLSEQYGFYRQNYCGCIYSKLERDRESAWSKKAAAERNKFRENKDEIPFPETGDEIDLHHFHPADTERVVKFYLGKSIEKKLKKVRIIHGKGRSKKKKEIYDILKNHPSVISFNDDSWNWGATVVYLKIADKEN
jgi:predicted adenine nucleotide alpha hydrolase (AANH) superfamily ATPase